MIPENKRGAWSSLYLLAANFRLYQNLQFWSLRTVWLTASADLYLYPRWK